MKWAQWSATRSDLFPDALCAALGRLQAGAPVHGVAHTRRLVADAVGCDVEDYFEAFDFAPVASGSIAQVHRATRKGEALAVKVRHPRVGPRLRIDARLLAVLAGCLEIVPALRAFRLRDTVAQFGATLAQQSRLDREAAQLVGFRRRFGRWRDVDFPAPKLATPSVIVESFLEGEIVVGIARRQKEQRRLGENRTRAEKRIGAHGRRADSESPTHRGDAAVGQSAATRRGDAAAGR